MEILYAKNNNRVISLLLLKIFSKNIISNALNTLKYSAPMQAYNKYISKILFKFISSYNYKFELVLCIIDYTKKIQENKRK